MTKISRNVLLQRKKRFTGKANQKWLNRMAKQGKLLLPTHPDYQRIRQAVKTGLTRKPRG